jgi:hypothetical protein
MAQPRPRWQQFAGSIAENCQRHLVPTIFAPWAEEMDRYAARLDSAADEAGKARISPDKSDEDADDERPSV